MKKIVVIGGGTFSHTACHLSLASPAFGSVALQLFGYLHDPLGFSRLPDDVKPVLKLTKMADRMSNLVTNKDVGNYIDELLIDGAVKVIVMSAALCDFTMPNPTNQTRLSSSEDHDVKLFGDTHKVIQRIKVQRPDIFVVGFKTTAGATQDEQVAAADALLNSSKADLVLANDISTRNNLLVSKSTVASACHFEGKGRALLLNSIAQKRIDWCEKC